MDSFYDEPRTIPKPTPVIQEIESLSVPEVSLLFQNYKGEKTPVDFKHQPLQSYNAWKLRTSPNSNNSHSEFDSFALPNNKENVGVQDIINLNKKQVRFESPALRNHYSPPVLQREMKFTYNSALEKPVVTSKQDLGSAKNYVSTSRYQTIISQCETVTSRPDTIMSKSATGTNIMYKPETVVSKPETFMYKPETSRSEITVSKPTITTSKPEINIPRQNYPLFLPNTSTAVSPSPTIKPFEKFYVSNIPNRELDLSLLDTQTMRCPTRKTNHTSVNTNLYDKDFSTRFIKENLDALNNETQKQNESSTKILTSTATNTTLTSVDKEDNQNETVENRTDVNETDKTPTVTDLLTIIKLQNKQLQLLQEQVDKLIKLNENNGKNDKIVEKKDEAVETTFYTNEQMSVIPESDENRSKISVGLMTSFEVSFKPNGGKKSKPKNVLDCVNSNDVSFHESQRIQKRKRVVKKSDDESQDDVKNDECFSEKNCAIVNDRKVVNETEYSLGSHEVFDVREPPESPECSIHIDMNDYDTGTESEDENSSTDVGWTFYRDILGQVNNILENSSPAGRENFRKNRKHPQENKITDTTLQKIKNAALQRLKTESFVKARSGDKKRHAEAGGLKPNDISFAVKQLLMKYMPDDGVANVVTRNEQEYMESSPNDISAVTTFKYMQQCNVVTNKNPYYATTENQNKPKTYSNKYKRNANDTEQKILDITTLKQQPKLL